MRTRDEGGSKVVEDMDRAGVGVEHLFPTEQRPP